MISPTAVQEFGLAEGEVRTFFEQGFIGPFRVYDRKTALELADCIVRKGRERASAVYGPDNQVNYDRHLDIDELADHVCRPEIVGKVRSLLGPDLFCWRGEYFIKAPGSPGTEWHQVEAYRYSTGTAHLAPTVLDYPLFQVTVWTAFTEATRNTACMKFMPGSHKKWFFDEGKPVERGRGLYEASDMAQSTGFFGYQYADFKIDPNWSPDESQARDMEMQPGEFIIFTAKCMHGSQPNRSKYSVRLAYAARYVPTHVRIYPEITSFAEHGSQFSLDDYGAVLVAGKDKYGHNKVRTTMLSGRQFTKPF